MHGKAEKEQEGGNGEREGREERSTDFSGSISIALLLSNLPFLR